MHMPVYAWFLEIAFMRTCVHVYVCVSIAKAINNLWQDLDFVRMIGACCFSAAVKKFYC